ncbi:hypothetical protein GGI24_003778, partial [Coemansia furcata]
LERIGYFIVDQVAAQSEVGAVTLVRIPDGKAASMASKHTGDVSTKSASAASTAGNPWDKKKGKATKSSPSPSANSLGLGSQSDFTSMYEIKPVYGDMQMDDASSVTSMYSTSKIY